MRTPAIIWKGNGASSALPIITLAAGLTLGVFSSALAKKGGNGGGGGDDGGSGGSTVTEHPAPPVVAAPVDYISTELRWENDAEFNDPGFQGIWLGHINSHGLVVGFVKRPAPAGSPEGAPGERRGVINLDPETGDATNTMVDLNVLFADSLAALNAGRTDGPWRIGYGREINGAGLIGCQLIPMSAARSYDTSQAAAAGVAPVPTLIAVADLQREEPNAMLVVDPDNTSPEQELIQMNEFGDLLVRDVDWVNDIGINRVHRLGADGAGDWVYEAFVVPSVGSPNFVSFNSSLQVLYGEARVDKWSQSSSLYQYSVATGEQVLLVETENNPVFSKASGIAEDNTAYAWGSSKTGKGNRNDGFNTPFHITSPTERRPLTTTGGEIFLWGRGVSRAVTSGEEEVFIRHYDPAEYQVYKPNFGARFVLPITPGSLGWAVISPPLDPQGVSSESTYNGGNIAYTTLDPASRSFVLTPVPVAGQ